MRELFDSYRVRLEEFIEQRDDLILLACCSDDDFGFALQLLKEIEQAGAADLFLLFSDPFTTTEDFLRTTMRRLADQHQTACDWLAEQGKGPLPPLPAALLDGRTPARDRLVQAIGFVRSLLPPGQDNRVIWAMLPTQIADMRAYLELVAGLVAWKGVEPWMRGTRLVLRAPDDVERQQPRLAQAPRLRRMRLSLGPRELEGNLQKQVEDESLPLEQRMNALLSLAIIDYGYNRTEDATARYMHLLGHYQGTGNKALEAFVLNGLGDVARRQGDLDRAREWYECGIRPAGEAKAGVVLASIVRGLGDVAYEQKRYADAEQFYDQLDKLTASTLDAECKARALEWRGLSQEQQKKVDQAIASWRLAADFGKKMWLPRAVEDSLRHLARVHQAQGQREQARAVEAEIEAVRAEGASP